jgi:hypothetical protein
MIMNKKCIFLKINMRYLFLLFIFNFSLFSHQVYIIVHGTWGLEKTWYVPGGDFFDALEISAKEHNATVVPFSWTGKNSIQARQKAAQNLTKLIETYDKATEITVIAHSHGGNVTIIASHLLHKNKIFCLYTLGTPINRSLYPNMDTIRYCYNFFSFEDLVQPVLGMFEREYAPHERIANVRIVINGKEPDHTDLHHTLVGKWLPQLHYIGVYANIKMFEPSILYFSDTQSPVYKVDANRTELLERDRQLSLLILYSLRKTCN